MSTGVLIQPFQRSKKVLAMKCSETIKSKKHSSEAGMLKVGLCKDVGVYMAD